MLIAAAAQSAYSKPGAQRHVFDARELAARSLGPARHPEPRAFGQSLLNHDRAAQIGTVVAARLPTAAQAPAGGAISHDRPRSADDGGGDDDGRMSHAVTQCHAEST
jgi:hypothetical protein